MRADETVTLQVANAKLTVDAAISPNGQWMALAMPGKPEGEASVEVIPVDGGYLFGDSLPAAAGLGQATAVAYTPGGTLVMQSREPARLMMR